MTLYTAYEPYKARNWKCAQPHVLRNRIERISYELRFALPATVPTRAQPAPEPCRAIVPYEPQCLAIVPHKEPKPRPPKIIPYPAVGRKSPILPYPAPPKRERPTRQERHRIFADAIRNPNLSVDDIIALSDQHLQQTAREIYYGA